MVEVSTNSTAQPQYLVDPATGLPVPGGGGGGGGAVTGPLGRSADAASVSVALSTEDVALLDDIEGALAGASTAAKQDTQITAEQAILAKIIAAPATEAKQDTQVTALTAANASLDAIEVSVAAATPAGTNIIGKVGIDQTTPGTTDSVTIATAQGAGAAIGVTTGAAVVTDANGTIQQYLRGLIVNTLALIARLPAALGAGGGLKVDGSGTALPVSGTVAVTGVATEASLAAAATSLDAIEASVAGATPAGGNLIGKVGIDQTTPGTTNLVALTANQSVNVAQINGVTTTMGNGASGTGVLRVTIASDSTGTLAINSPSGGLNNGVSLNYLGGTALSVGAGTVGGGVQRVTHASDDPVTTALQIMDDWDETDRAKVNLIAGQAGITGGAGAVASSTPRVTHASDDPVTTALQIMDDWDESDRAKVNLVAGQAGIDGGSGSRTAKTVRVAEAGMEYETVAASQTAQVLGATGATGDFLSHVIFQPTTTAAGTCTVLDNATVIFTYTTGTLSDLRPIVVPFNLTSVSGAFKITTGANVTAIGIGDFT